MQAPAVRIRRRCDTSTKFDYNRSHLTPSPALPLLDATAASTLMARSRWPAPLRSTQVSVSPGSTMCSHESDTHLSRLSP